MRGDLRLAKQRHSDALTIRTALGEKGTAAESRSALAVIALEEGRAAEAETLAADAATVFAGQSAPDNEATARAVLALAMLTQGRRAPAVREIERAQALVKSPQHVLARLPVMIAAARISSEDSAGGALSRSRRSGSKPSRRGIARSEFEARRAIAEIEGRRSLTAGAKLIEALRSTRRRAASASTRVKRRGMPRAYDLTPRSRAAAAVRPASPATESTAVSRPSPG